MPRFEREMCLTRPVAAVFDFFCHTANWIRLAPPQLHLRLVDGPDRLHLGASFTVKGRRWGLPQRVVSDITAFEPDTLLVDQQRQGPFGKWVHTHRFAALDGETRLVDQVDYEPPGGMLGRLVTAASLARDLEWVFAFRDQQLRELLIK